MITFPVVVYNTSRFCAFHNVKVERKPRGVVNCPIRHSFNVSESSSMNEIYIIAGVIALIVLLIEIFRRFIK